MPIQPVASDCSSTAPSERGSLRSITVMLSSPRKPPSNTLLPSRSTLLTQLAKLISSLWKQRSSHSRSACAVADPIHVVDPPHRPRVDRRVEIAELPLVRGELAARVLELLEQQQPELVLGELRVDQRERHALEREVPRGEPRVLPLVGHRHHPHRVEVAPVAVADLRRDGGGGCAGIVAVEPARDVEQVALLAPQEPRQRTALHEPLVGGGLARGQRRVERVGLGLARGDDRVDGRRARRRVALSVNRRRSVTEPPAGTT